VAPIPWAGRVWALPFLTVLAPSERWAQATGRRHKLLTDWARQMLLQVARWLPERQVIVVADMSYAAIELLEAVRRHLTVVTRLRLDARLFDPPPPRHPGQRGRPRVSGARQPTLAQRLTSPTTRWRRVTIAHWYGGQDRRLAITSGTALWYHPGKSVPIRWVLVRDVAGAFEPQALLSTDLTADPVDVLRWFVRRWSVEVTFAEVRRHLGVETQRQWSDRAIARTTPALLGLFSLVTLWAGEALNDGWEPRQAAWYTKSHLTFSDALAIVRAKLWAASFETSRQVRDVVKIPRALLNRLTEAACFPA
jgi:DDE superfamily endonuclease